MATRSPLPGLDVPVHAVVGDVELAVREPLGERRVRPVERLGRLRGPGQPAGLLGPEAEPVRLGLLVRLRCDVGVRRPDRRAARTAAPPSSRLARLSLLTTSPFPRVSVVSQATAHQTRAPGDKGLPKIGLDLSGPWCVVLRAGRSYPQTGAPALGRTAGRRPLGRPARHRSPSADRPAPRPTWKYIPCSSSAPSARRRATDSWAARCSNCWTTLVRQSCSTASAGARPGEPRPRPARRARHPLQAGQPVPQPPLERRLRRRPGGGGEQRLHRPAPGVPAHGDGPHLEHVHRVLDRRAPPSRPPLSAPGSGTRLPTLRTMKRSPGPLEVIMR